MANHAIESQSYIIDEENGIRTSMRIKNKELKKLYQGKYTTISQKLWKSMLENVDKKCLGVRPEKKKLHQWITYRQVFTEINKIYNWLNAKIILPVGETNCIGIYAANCPQWTIVANSCYIHGMVVVPLYDTLGHESTLHILNQSELRVLFCGDPAYAAKVLAMADQLHHLKIIVVMAIGQSDDNGDGEAELVRLRATYGDRFELHVYADIIRDTSDPDYKELPNNPQPDDLAMICYTSGTTGVPKGVMLSHRNLVATLAGMEHIHETITFTDMTHLSFLPLAHIFETLVQILLLCEGAKIAFLFGSVLNIFTDLAEVKPTVFFTVPRIFIRVHDQYKKQIKPDSSPEEKAKRMADVREMFGGQVQKILTGGSPMPRETMQFIREVFACTVYEAYGQTESCGLISITECSETRAGVVGPPALSVQVKLADVPDLDLVAKRDNRGEICARGDNCTKGYFKDAAKTAELLDAEGWLHTGDIAEWTSEGTLRIVDRCKHIFKLSQGEYVAPEKLEAVYNQCCLIEQIFVDGNGEYPNPVALVLPDAVEQLRRVKAAIANNKKTPADAEKEAMHQLKEDILAEMNQLATQAKFAGFERVQGIYLINEAFSLENNLMTPTMKLCRGVIRKKYSAHLAEIYKQVK